MILIAESGSTKTDWQLISGKDTVMSFSSNGINPTMQTLDDIKTNQDHYLDQIQKFPIRKVAFYGAGCGSEMACDQVISYLSERLPNAEVSVQSDLMAAAQAVLGSASGLVCILGTGSNSGYFESNRLVHQVPSLGYLLGDEGSGSQIGKMIVTDFMRGNMPEQAHQQFANDLKLDSTDLVQHIYRQPYPNRYLASMVKVMASSEVNQAYLREVIRTQFQLFFKNCISKYNLSSHDRLGFVGSIAFLFKDILEKVANGFGLKIESIVHRPIEKISKNIRSEWQQSIC